MVSTSCSSVMASHLVRRPVAAAKFAPAPAVFSPFGQAPPQACFAWLKFANKQYSNYPAPNKPFCGTHIPNSNAA